MRYLLYGVLLLLLFSCKQSRTDELKGLVEEWIGKEITLNSMYDSLINVGNHTHTIVSYVDSLGCISCKLQLNKWATFKNVLDSLTNLHIVFIVHPFVKKDIGHLFKSYHYFPDLCIVDSGNNFRQNLPLFQKNELQTLLLDKGNRVVAIGNPVHNPRVKELYLKIIRGENSAFLIEENIIKTKVDVDATSAFLGNFDWQKEQKTSFRIKNIGNKLLVIQDVNTSCGCITVNYSKEPVLPGEEITLEVIYKAEHPEHFNKTISVYCNAEISPVVLKISGNAK